VDYFCEDWVPWMNVEGVLREESWAYAQEVLRVEGSADPPQ
jgi:hypothetical protein